jgi:steroid delta-isomerase-like uncharacterized protein
MRLSDRVLELWREVEEEGRIDAMDEYFAEDYVRHSEEGDASREEFKQIIDDLHAGFPDLTFEVLDLVEEGDRVAYRWRSTGTHDGPYLDVPATHRRVVASGLTISRFDDDGRTVEDWASWNKVSVLHTLGIIPIGRGSGSLGN